MLQAESPRQRRGNMKLSKQAIDQSHPSSRGNKSLPKYTVSKSSIYRYIGILLCYIERKLRVPCEDALSLTPRMDRLLKYFSRLTEIGAYAVLEWT